jgi:CubicO group peptidase (beta-lactamase class C family)
MRFFTVFFLYLFTTLTFSQHAQDLTKPQLIDSLLKESHRRGIFNGNALVAVNDDIIYNAAIGFADAGRSTPLQPHLRLNIGSVSKEFDGMGIMILKEEGKLSLDDKLITFFPELPKWSENISLRNLLQYTSGLPATDHKKVLSDAQVWEFLHSVEKLNFEPGTAYNYNNIDVFLRKRVIEKASNMTYAGFVVEKMLKPCGMENAVLDPDATTPNFTRSFDESYVQDDLKTYMSGWVAVNTEDMFKWVQCLNSQKLISEGNLEELAQSFKPSSQSPLGLSVYKSDTLMFRYHHGQNNNFEAGIVWIPDPGHTIILLTNNRSNELGDHINAIDAILRGQEFTIPKRSIELSLRAKIYHEGYESGIEFLKSIKRNKADIFNFEREARELVNTGTWLREKDRDRDGIRVLEYTSSQFPESVEAHYELALAYEEAGEFSSAMTAYERVIDLEPKHATATQKLKELKK